MKGTGFVALGDNITSCLFCFNCFTDALGFYLVTFTLGLEKQPNFLVIEVDDFGYNDVSWNNPAMITPELERLAKEGVILDTFYTAPRCSPSR